MTEYSQQIYGLGGFAYTSDDNEDDDHDDDGGDGGGDSEATSSYQSPAKEKALLVILQTDRQTNPDAQHISPFLFVSMYFYSLSFI